MGRAPETRYAKSGDTHIAYQIVGDGPVDLVFFGSIVSHVELIWEEPSAARLFERLAGFTRLIIFDKRGVGMSDPVPPHEPPTLEQRLEDVRAVMDAAGSEQAALFGTSDGGQLAVLFATTYPARTRALVLFSTAARVSRDEVSYPIGVSDKLLEWFIGEVERDWGGPLFLETVIPSIREDERRVQWWSQFARRSISPGAAATQLRMTFPGDVCGLLPIVQAPTLVLHAADEQFLRAAHGRYLAEHIPEARYVELAGADHLPFSELADPIADEVQEFLTGVREPSEPDRVLATVLFTDIVGSTSRAAAEGDRQWRERLDAHDQTVRRQLDRFRGREVKATGDGFLAFFDGPARAIRCGEAIREAARSQGLEVRIGVHTGEVELRDADIGGIAVHIGARIAGLADAGEVLVSGAVPPLVVGSGIEFMSRGVHVLKGVPGEWEVFTVART